MPRALTSLRFRAVVVCRRCGGREALVSASQASVCGACGAPQAVVSDLGSVLAQRVIVEHGIPAGHHASFDETPFVYLTLARGAPVCSFCSRQLDEPAADLLARGRRGPSRAEAAAGRCASPFPPMVVERGPERRDLHRAGGSAHSLRTIRICTLHEMWSDAGLARPVSPEDVRGVRRRDRSGRHGLLPIAAEGALRALSDPPALADTRGREHDGRHAVQRRRPAREHAGRPACRGDHLQRAFDRRQEPQLSAPPCRARFSPIVAPRFRRPGRARDRR